jgi:aldehyde:ferredoxin oxidoreductase
MQTILRIDMCAKGGPKFTKEPLGKYAGYGGRELTSSIVSGEVLPRSHALGAKNKLVIAPAFLAEHRLQCLAEYRSDTKVHLQVP